MTAAHFLPLVIAIASELPGRPGASAVCRQRAALHRELPADRPAAAGGGRAAGGSGRRRARARAAGQAGQAARTRDTSSRVSI